MLEGLALPKKVAPCKVRELLDSLEAKDKQILSEALVDPAWGHLTLTNSLNALGIEISEHPIRKHRLGRCSCA